MSNLTVEDIYGRSQDLLKFDGTDIGLPGMEEPRTIEWISDLKSQFFDEFYALRINPPDYLKSSVGYDAVGNTRLAEDTDAGDTSFTVEDSDYLPSSGVAVVYGNTQYDIFSFTTNAAETVSGVPATGRDSLSFAHTEGQEVSRLYPLPADFGRMRPERKYDSYMKNHEGVQVDGLGYRQVPDAPSGQEFSVYQGSDGLFYLWLPRNTTGQIMVHYDMLPTPLTTTSDDVGIPSPHHNYLVHGLVAIFKQIQDEDYVPTKEQNEQQKVIRNAIVKRSGGKPVSGNSKFFNRYR